MRRGTRNLVFVHGISGPPATWDAELLATLSTLEPSVGPIATHTVRYDDVFTGEINPDAPAPGKRRRPIGPSVRARRRESLVQIAVHTESAASGKRSVSVAAPNASSIGHGTGDSPRIVPPQVVGELLLRSPVGGMDQARAYRHDTTISSRVRARVATEIDRIAGPRIVIGHSMGSIVALEALHEYGINVDLMVTLGSPLGVDPAWRRRWLIPEKFRWPRVGAWVNVVNVRDPVSWGHGVSQFYPQAVDVFIRAGILPFGPGGAHDPSTYLRTDPVPRLLLAT
jgi:pimeloyl-ACP methyl ester carboxylesterase